MYFFWFKRELFDAEQQSFIFYFPQVNDRAVMNPDNYEPFFFANARKKLKKKDLLKENNSVNLSIIDKLIFTSL